MTVQMCLNYKCYYCCVWQRQDVFMSRAARFSMKVRACHVRHDVPNVLQKWQLTFTKEENQWFS